MAEGVFDSKAGSGYDQIAAHRFLPRHCLKAAEATMDGWIAYASLPQVAAGLATSVRPGPRA